MKVRAIRNGEFTDVYDGAGDHIFETDHWPAGLNIQDYLRALYGATDDKGWFVCHEHLCECGWIVRCMEIASDLSRQQIGTLAIADPVDLRTVPSALIQIVFGKPEPPISLIAAAAMATKVYAKAWEATEEEAAEIVRMNLFSERAMV